MGIYQGYYTNGQIVPESRRIPYLTESQMVYIIPTKKKKPSLESDNGKADEAVVNIKYDNEAKVWIAVSDYLALESESYDELLKLIEGVTQDMINHKECPYFDSIKVVTENRNIGIDVHTFNDMGEGLGAIEKALDKCRIPKNCYSLEREKEECVCLIFEDNEWKVTTFEKGNRILETCHENLDDAAHRLFALLSSSTLQMKRLKKLYMRYKSKYQKGKRICNVVILKENMTYIAKDICTDVASQGNTIREAVKNLKEALTLYYEDNQEQD